MCSSDRNTTYFQDSCCNTIVLTSAVNKTRDDATVQTAARQSLDVSSGPTLGPQVKVQTQIVCGPVENTSNLPLKSIKRLISEMIYELDRPDDAFVGFYAQQMTESRDVSYKYTLTCQNSNALKCVGVSWNATGAMLCAVFGLPDLTGWCDKSGTLSCWSLFRQDFSPNNPTVFTEHSSCYTTIACHPLHPSLIAAGSFDGEILIYDISSSQDSLRASSSVGEYFHREPIQTVTWVRNSVADAATTEAYHLVSISSETKVLWWSLNTINHACAERGGKLPHPVRGMSIDMAPNIAFSSLAIATSDIIVGSVGGKIIRCYPHSRTGMNREETNDNGTRWEKSAIDFAGALPLNVKQKLIKHVNLWACAVRKRVIAAADIFASKPRVHHVFPVQSGSLTEYEAHVGPVTRVCISPFHRRLFFSVGVDGYVKLRSTMQTQALMRKRAGNGVAADGIYAADWSKVRPLVFAVAGDAGKVQIHDLGSRRPMLPLTELEIPRLSSGADTCTRILALQFNPKQRDLLACGDAAGQVHVWQLSWRLSNATPDESAQLHAFVEDVEESHF